MRLVSDRKKLLISIGQPTFWFNGDKIGFQNEEIVSGCFQARWLSFVFHLFLLSFDGFHISTTRGAGSELAGSAEFVLGKYVDGRWRVQGECYRRRAVSAAQVWLLLSVFGSIF